MKINVKGRVKNISLYIDKYPMSNKSAIEQLINYRVMNSLTDAQMQKLLHIYCYNPALLVDVQFVHGDY